MASTPETSEPACICSQYARATERAALGSARWLGAGNQTGAEEAAFSGMRSALVELPIAGSHRDRSDRRAATRSPPAARSASGRSRSTSRSIRSRAAASSRAAGLARCRSSPSAAPARCRSCRTCTCARSPSAPRARGAIDLLKPVAENVAAIAEEYGRSVNDVTTIVLDRPRHHDLIEDIRRAGARIKLIPDGTVTAAISAAIRGTNDHLAIGIGGTRQAVLTAAALRCLGGELQAQIWPTSTTGYRRRTRARDRRRRARVHH